MSHIPTDSMTIDTSPAAIAALTQCLQTLGRDMDRHAAPEWDEHENVFLAVNTIDALAAERDAQAARADAAEAEVARLKDENERLSSLVDSAEGILANCEVSAGVCCCGENMDGHSNPMECGHSPVDMGECSASQWIAALQRKAGE